jgi:ABC-type uncharacterized transport system ATPase subunit
MHIKHITRERYYASHHDVLYGLFKQVERLNFLAELENMATREREERIRLQIELARCKKELQTVRQHIGGVSKVGFNPVQNKITPSLINPSPS